MTVVSPIVRIKKVSATKLFIEASRKNEDNRKDMCSVNVNAMYSPNALVQSLSGAACMINLDAIHGTIQAEANRAEVTLRRITGNSRVILNAGGSVHAEFDMPHGRSELVNKGGGVVLMVNHQAFAKIKLTSDEAVSVVSNERSFVGEVKKTTAVGVLTPDESRANALTGSAMGKVALDAAERSSFSTSFFGGDDDCSPEIVAEGTSAVELESLSWRDSIMRQFEMD